MKLYEIDRAIQAVYDQIEHNDGVLPDELESQLDGLQMERTTKIGNILKLLKNIGSDETALEVEITLLEKKLSAVKNRKQTVKNYLAYAIGEGNKFKDTVSSVYWMTSESIDVTDIEMLPAKFCRIEKSPDKKAIKQALDAGIVLNGCQIVTKQSIVVR